MCGIVGLISGGNANQEIYDALNVIQHRGQDAAGIITTDNQRVYLRKGNGLVRDVLQARHMSQLLGNMGIGHVRYPTAGTSLVSEAQPLYVNSPFGLCLAHNGNLINTEELARGVLKTDLRHLNTGSDSEVLLNIFAHQLQKSVQGLSLQPRDIFAAVTEVQRQCLGAYAVVIMIVGYGLLAFRDPFAIRPLIWGQRKTQQGMDTMFASESVALDALGFDVVDDLDAGEAIYVDLQGEVYRENCAASMGHKPSPCLFEYVYLARPDSVMDGISVYHARMNMGRVLAKQIQLQHDGAEIDVVIPIPDTSRTAAMTLAQELDIDYREGFVKNRYIGRTFIMPGQEVRKKSVRQKLNVIGSEFAGKNVLLVDDSIVRGTTSKQVVRLARESGAKKVFFASMAPHVRYPNVYGINIPSVRELIAYNRNEEEMADLLGVDWLIFQQLSDLKDAVSSVSGHMGQFEDCVFSGSYVTGSVSEDYLKHIENVRYQQSQQTTGMDCQVVEVFNNS